MTANPIQGANHSATAATQELHPVVEAPWFEGVPPWPIADRKPFSFIRLSGDMTELEVGSVMAQLINYNNEEFDSTVVGLLAATVAEECLSLPGGIQASDGGREINPGCCCGLEEWREWLECPTSGRSSTMGHDPFPWIEWAEDIGNGSPDSNAFTIAFERERFVAQLERVERELRAFLLRVEAWAEAVGFPDPPALCRRLDACFGITEPVVAE